MAAEPHDPVRCLGVELSGTAVRRVAGGGIALAVPRERIRRIRVGYDTSAAHPFLQFFLGFVLLALGALGVLVLLLASWRGSLPIAAASSGALSLQLVPAALWLMTAAGTWLLAGVLRACYHLVVETESGVVTMLLGRSADLEEVRRFVRKARWTFGYEIDASILEDPQRPR